MLSSFLIENDVVELCQMKRKRGNERERERERTHVYQFFESGSEAIKRFFCKIWQKNYAAVFRDSSVGRTAHSLCKGKDHCTADLLSICLVSAAYLFGQIRNQLNKRSAI